MPNKISSIDRPVHTVHNFDNYNTAVHLELQRHQEARKTLQGKAWLLKAKAISIFLLTCATIAFICFLIYFLYSGKTLLPNQAIDKPKQKTFDGKTPRQLQEIAEVTEATVPPFSVEKKFTVVSAATMITGEKVVTAEEFTPENLREPDWVYCYVSQASGNSQNAEYLASYKDQTLTVETVDDYLLENALPLCNFPKK